MNFNLLQMIGVWTHQWRTKKARPENSGRACITIRVISIIRVISVDLFFQHDRFLTSQWPFLRKINKHRGRHEDRRVGTCYHAH